MKMKMKLRPKLKPKLKLNSNQSYSLTRAHSTQSHTDKSQSADIHIGKLVLKIITKCLMRFAWSIHSIRGAVANNVQQVLQQFFFSFFALILQNHILQCTQHSFAEKQKTFFSTSL